MVNHMMKKILLVLTFLSVNNAWAAYSPGTFIVDQTGANAVAVKAASTAPINTDPSLVVTISPNGNTVSATNPSVSATGAAVPASGTFMGVKSGANLVGLTYGQAVMAASLPVTFASDQSSIPVTGTFWQATQPVSGTFWQATQPVSIAATVATNVAQFGGTNVVTGIGASGLGIPRFSLSNDSLVGLVSGSSIVGKFGIDQTTPGTTNGVQINAALPSGTNIIGKVSIDQTTQGTTNFVTENQTQVGGSAVTLGSKTSANSYPVVIASDQGSLQTKSSINVTGSGSAAAATVSTVATLTAPGNAVGFILMNLDTSNANIRWAVGRTASTTLGQQLQPGRDTGFVPIGANVSIIAESGTQNYDIQWIAQ